MAVPGALPPSIVREAFRIADRPLSAEEGRAIAEFGRFCREELEPAAVEIDRSARPGLRAPSRGASGVPEVRLSASHRRMLDRLYASGLALGPTRSARDWPVAFALMHEAAEIGFLCSATVTLATVYALAKWGSSDLRERYLTELVATRGRAQGATWATEEQGGSDLGANATHATPIAQGRWALSGEKFFCSNVGASCAVVTARPDGASEGIHGIRLFFVPARRADGTPNWRVRRLKEKLGTIAVPTGEVGFDRAEAYALGPESAGVLPAMEMLNVSRVANAVGSAGVLQRASEWSIAFARRRQAFGKPLIEHPLLALDVATLATESDAASLLAFDAVFSLAKSAGEMPPYSPDAQVMRFTTHIAKLVTAEQAVRGTALAMEVRGGMGYLEEEPLAKLARDALVTPIWEGGANLQALDAREVMRRHRSHKAWEAAAGRAAGHSGSAEVRRFIATRVALTGAQSEEIDAKHVARTWGSLRQLTLLVERSHRAPENPCFEARAELFARLRADRPGVDFPRGLVERALGAV